MFTLTISMKTIKSVGQKYCFSVLERCKRQYMAKKWNNYYIVKFCQYFNLKVGLIGQVSRHIWAGNHQYMGELLITVWYFLDYFFVLFSTILQELTVKHLSWKMAIIKRWCGAKFWNSSFGPPLSGPNQSDVHCISELYDAHQNALQI